MLSVSMLSSYEYCKRKLFLNYVLKFFEPVKKSTSLGTIRHETYDGINKAEESLVKSIKQRLKKEEILDIYKQKYSEILREVIRKNKRNLEELKIDLGEVFKNVWPLILEESETRASYLFEFIQMNNVYGEELWEKLTPKIHSEVRIESEKLNLKGIIDQLEIYKAGIVPVELKTGSMPNEGVWPGHRLQIAAYALLAQEHFKQEVKEGFVLYLDQKERRHIAMNPFMIEEIKDLIKKIDNLLSSKQLPEIVSNTNKCNQCGLRDICNNEQLLKDKLEELKNRK
jgi:CRISPR-associated protein Cas4